MELYGQIVEKVIAYKRTLRSKCFRTTSSSEESSNGHRTAILLSDWLDC